jgi:hypothetical protein
MLHIKSFVDIYEDASIDSVHMASHNGNKYVVKIKGKLYVEDKKLLKRREFIIKVKHMNQDNFYRLKDLGMSGMSIARFVSTYSGSISTWNQYISRDLFSLAYTSKSILNYKVSKRDWIFNKATRALLRGIKNETFQ